MEKGTLIKIKSAKQFILHGDKFKNKLAIWLNKLIIDGNDWHKIKLCHNNKTECVYDIEMEVLSENKKR